MLGSLKWNDLGSVIYTLSHVPLLSSPEEWEEVIALFLARAKQDFDQERIIKGLTSLSLAQVQSRTDFWIDVFLLVAEKLSPEGLDPFLKMNLLWSMARNRTSIQDSTFEHLTSMVVGSLSKDLETFLRGNREALLINFLPNLVWSVESLQLKDEALWTNIDRLVLKVSGSFSITQLASLMPVYLTPNPRVAQSLLERFTALPR